MDSSIPVFEPASPQADAIYHLFLWVILISGVIFLIVGGLIVVAIYRFRARENETPQAVYGDDRREMRWLVGPTIVVLWLVAISAKFVLTYNAVPKVDPPGDTVADLVVTGHQWWWEVHYVGASVIGANEVHIPTNKRLRVKVSSADVIHCFWVPQLARKIDVIPGRDNYIWLEAHKPGAYQGRCAEYCGTQHAWMNFKVYAHAADDYERWLTQQKEVPSSPPSTHELAVAGKAFFLTATCIECHTIEGTPAHATIGPNLTHFELRKEIGGGRIANSPESLALWLKNPQALKPGCKMPNFKLTGRQIDQLVAYLYPENSK